MPDKTEKSRRMMIRCDIGNREIKAKPTSSTSHRPSYLVAHACFNCRKSFKRHPTHEHVCPECGGPAYWMGRAFKAPKQKDHEQWRKVQILYALGFRFHRYGGNYEPLPEYLHEVASFVERNPDHKLRVAEPDLSLLPRER
jgi:hypothetical protein